jgi:hypothetical protein
VQVVVGLVLGVMAPGFSIDLKFFSDAFLKLISMIVAPIAAHHHRPLTAADSNLALASIPL